MTIEARPDYRHLLEQAIPADFRSDQDSQQALELTLRYLDRQADRFQQRRSTASAEELAQIQSEEEATVSKAINHLKEALHLVSDTDQISQSETKPMPPEKIATPYELALTYLEKQAQYYLQRSKNNPNANRAELVKEFRKVVLNSRDHLQKIAAENPSEEQGQSTLNASLGDEILTKLEAEWASSTPIADSSETKPSDSAPPEVLPFEDTPPNPSPAVIEERPATPVPDMPFMPIADEKSQLETAKTGTADVAVNEVVLDNDLAIDVSELLDELQRGEQHAELEGELSETQAHPAGLDSLASAPQPPEVTETPQQSDYLQTAAEVEALKLGVPIEMDRDKVKAFYAMLPASTKIARGVKVTPEGIVLSDKLSYVLEDDSGILKLLFTFTLDQTNKQAKIELKVDDKLYTFAFDQTLLNLVKNFFSADSTTIESTIFNLIDKSGKGKYEKLAIFLMAYLFVPSFAKDKK